jgi:HEAT repeat protein
VEAVPALSTALKDASADARKYAARALGRIGPKAKSAVKALQAARDDSDASVRVAATDALRKIEPEAKP